MNKLNLPFYLRPISAILWIGLIIISIILANCFILNNNLINYLATFCLSILFIITCAMLIVVTYEQMQKGFIRVAVGLLIFIFGVITYTIYYLKSFEITDKIPHFLAAINSTLSIFYPSRGNYDNLRYSDSLFLIFFHLLHILSYIFAFALALSLIGRKMMNRALLFLQGGIKTRYIFFGASEQAQILAESIILKEIRNNDAQIVFILKEAIDKEKYNTLFKKLDKKGIVCLSRPLDGSNMNEITLRTLKSDCRFFFIEEDEDLNVSLALKALERIEKLNKNINTQIHLYIKTETEGIDKVFEQRKMGINIELHIFNQSDLMARIFVADNPVLGTRNMKIDENKFEVSGSFNLLLLGFGWAGREILTKTICDGQYLNCRFSATIFDDVFEEKRGAYALAHQDCKERYNLTFNPRKTKVGSGEFYNWIKENIKNFDRIIVCLGNDTQNVETALHLAKYLRQLGHKEVNHRIFANTKNKKNYNYYSNENKDRPISIFGDIESSYSYQNIINEELDTTAKMVNYVYSKSDIKLLSEINIADAVKIWNDEKTVFNRDSSIACAMNIENILRIISKTKETDFKILAEKIEYNIEYLAETEHLRWNAFHFTKGIKNLPVDEIPETNTTAKIKDETGQVIKHACLVDFEELDKVSATITKNLKKAKQDKEENYKDVDRRIIRHIPLFIKTLLEAEVRRQK